MRGAAPLPTNETVSEQESQPGLDSASHGGGWAAAEVEGRSRLFDGLHQSVDSERLVENGLQPFLAGFDNRVGRIPTKSGHQDDRYPRLNFAEAAVGLGNHRGRGGEYRRGPPRTASRLARAIASWASRAVSTIAP